MSERVWVKTGRNCGNGLRFYHTDGDCHLLKQAAKPIQKPPEVLPHDLEECPACADEADWGGTDEPFATRDKLLALDPDAVGGDGADV